VDMIARTTPAYRAMRKLAMVYKVISYILWSISLLLGAYILVK
jgi:hypothetical protein